MKKTLEIGEKVLMFKLIYDKEEKLDLLSSIVYNTPKEVVVKKHNNVIGCDIVTVEDELGDEYCGSYVQDNNRLGNIIFARRDEYIICLRNTFNKYYMEGYSPCLDYWTSDEIAIFKAINHQKNRVCNHLFVMQKNGYWYGGCHSSDYEYEKSTVTCVHCGLTNRWVPFSRYYLPFHYRVENETFNDFLDMYCTKELKYERGDESVVTSRLLSNRVYFLMSQDIYIKKQRN